MASFKTAPLIAVALLMLFGCLMFLMEVNGEVHVQSSLAPTHQVVKRHCSCGGSWGGWGGGGGACCSCGQCGNMGGYNMGGCYGCMSGMGGCYCGKKK
ncbi:hypothetical protein niasHT_039895 [Heterodera trifolii]|uniref:Uncharacterized protein n=1 Tax=Heterodera trifolii TaxID=157864 RepID=A0ABD2IFY4_9BILA